MDEVEELTPQQEFLGLVKTELDRHVELILDGMPSDFDGLFRPVLSSAMYNAAMGLMNVISGTNSLEDKGYWLIPKDAIESYGMDDVDIAPHLSTEYFNLINT